MFEKWFKNHLNPWRIRQVFIVVAGLNLIAAFIALPIITVCMILFYRAPFFTTLFDLLVSTVSAFAFAGFFILVADYISPIWPRGENVEEDK